MSILNVYAPTSLRTRELPRETDEFYELLTSTTTDYQRKCKFIFIGGDFNVEIGQIIELNKQFLGNHGKGNWNQNGHLLANFLVGNSYYATNTTFELRFKRRTTWTRTIGNKARYNQID